MGRLAGGVAHDFNNILVVILGYAELLLSKFKEKDTTRNQLERIVDAVNRAAALTKQILAFSRKQVIDLQVVSPNDIVSNTMSIVKTMLPEDVEIALNLSPEVSNIEADSHKIEQVLMNLVINARDAMPAGGRLFIKTNEMDIEETSARNLHLKNGRYAVISVCDTGIGIMDDVMPHIFEPFFTTKDKGKGTGLGLSVAYGIVRQHNGTIQVESMVGKGSEFHVYLPVTEKSKEKNISKPMQDKYDAFSGHERILVAEDNEAALIIISDTLTSLGYYVATAENGYEAVRLAEGAKEPFDMLVTDVIMPRMNGKELFERLSARYPSMKVLFISGYSDEIIYKSGVKDKNIALLEKPFDNQKLAKTVRQVLDANPL
ncbi:MAG: response regulator [Deltaproteobacteria bacterium]|nr:response regulator [Deltaproteobacteria bacterium]